MIKLREKFLLIFTLVLAVLGVASCKANEANAIKLRLEEEKLYLLVGETIEIEPNLQKGSEVGEVELVWSSLNESVATVVDGLIKAEGAGSTHIRVAVEGKAYIYDKVEVVVLDSYLPSLTFSTNVAEVLEGEQLQLEYQLTYPAYYEEEATVTWSVDNAEVASVDQNGLVVAAKAGSVLVKAVVANSSDSKEYVYNLVVTAKEFALTFELDGGKFGEYTYDEFADKLIAEFKKYNSAMTKEDFHSQSHPSIKSVFADAAVLAEYKWFFEFVKAELLDNYAAGEHIAETVELLEKLAAGDTTAINGSYANGRSVFRHFMHNLFNKNHESAGSTAGAYLKYTTDYSLAENQAEFMAVMTGVKALYMPGDELPVPTKPGYVFAGWYEGERKVEVAEKSTTLVAKWEEATYKVEFDLDGGQLGAMSYDQFVAELLADFRVYNSALQPASFQSDSHPSIKSVFGTAENLAKYQWFFQYMKAKLQATYLEDSYLTETYEMLDKMIAGDTAAISGSYANARTLIRHIMHNLINKDYSSQNAVFHAYSFDYSQAELQNEFVNVMNNLPTSYKYNQELPAATKEGYIFLGWFIGEEKVEKVTGDLSVKAHWELDAPKEYELVLNLNDGVLANAPNKYLVAEGLVLPIPTREGYNFLGWFDNIDLTGEAVTEIAKESTGDKEFYAKWEEKQVVTGTFNINYELNGGHWAQYNVSSYAEFTDAILTDFEAYFSEIAGKEVTINRIAENTDPSKDNWHIGDFMGVSYLYKDNIEAFFTTHPEYSAKWGWVYDLLKAEGIESDSAWGSYKTIVLRGWTHGFIYQSHYSKWPAGKDFSEYPYESFADKIIAQVEVPGAGSYDAEVGVKLEDVYKDGYEFKGWFLDAEFSGEALKEIAIGTSGDLTLYAKFVEIRQANKLYVGEDKEYKSIAEALKVAEEGDQIILDAGNYEGVVINKSVSILGPNAGVNPETDVRVAEAVLRDIMLIAANNVTVDGIQISSGGQIAVDPDQSISDLTVNAILVKEWDLAASDNAPIYLMPDTSAGTSENIYKNIVLSNSKFEANSGRMMIMYGTQVENLTVKGNYFYGANSSQYNDGLKFYATTTTPAFTPKFDVKGEVKIISNYFENYMQYPVWFNKYASGNYEILNNTFINCCQYTEYNEGCVTMNNFIHESGKTTIKVQYNTARNSQILARLHNAGATADNWAAFVNYNKIYENKHTQWITNRDSNSLDLIDATENYYDGKTPIDAMFDGVSSYAGFYASDADVPAYVEEEDPGQQEAGKFAISFKVNGGVLETVPRYYESNMKEALVLPIPTRTSSETAIYTFLGWYDNPELTGEPISEIAVGSTGAKSFYAKWGEKLPEGLYSIAYELNGGSWSYSSKTALLNDFLTDFYNFILEKGGFCDCEMTLQIFMHGEGKDSGYQGAWGSYLNPGAISYIGIEERTNFFAESSEIGEDDDPEEWFLHCSKYGAKWNSLYNYVEQMIKAVNSGQAFWGELGVGVFRLWQYVTGVNKYGSAPASWMANHSSYFTEKSVPEDMPTKLFYRVEEETFTLPVPSKENAVFEGWYDNPLYIGAAYDKLVPSMAKSVVFYAKWSETVEADIVVGAGETYETLAAALAVAEEGQVIELKPGTYSLEGIVKVNGLTIRGPQAGINPNKTTIEANSEAVFNEGTLAVNADVNGLTIDGVAFTATAKITMNEGNVSNFVLKNSHAYDLGKATEIFIQFATKGSKVSTLALINNLFEQVNTNSGMRYLRGDGIENFYLTGNVFNAGKADYTDIVRIDNDGAGVSGEIIVKNNEFNNAGQRALWIRKFSATKLEIVNNKFSNNGDQTYGGAVQIDGFNGASIEAIVEYNTFDVKEGLFALRLDLGSATLVGGAAQVHYNKFINVEGEKCEIIGPTTLTGTGIDAANNYYGGNAAPTDKIYGASNLDQYYALESAVPTVNESGEVHLSGLEFTSELTKLGRYTSYQLEWKTLPEHATDKRVVFESSDTSVLTVDKNGVVYAKGIGSATIKVVSASDASVYDEITIEAYAPDYVTGSYETESYVVKGESVKLLAEIVGASTGSIVWTSSDESVAKVDEDGNVTGVSAGYVTITASDSTDPTVKLEFGMTVIESALAEGVMTALAEAHENETYVKADLPIGSGIPVYYSTVVGSVSKIIFNHAFEQKEMPNKSDTNHGGTMTKVEFITVHYTGNMSAGADAAANASYFAGGGGGTSIHYTTGNDGVYHVLDNTLVGFHAGDGHSAASEIAWYKTGVMAEEGDPERPVVSINSDGKFTINGKVTTLTAPNGVKDPSYLTALGPHVEADETGEYIMAKTWWSDTYQKVASLGGNMNSIGIESCVNQGSDLWYTWQLTAQLVANLLQQNNLGLNRVKGHNFFSGKDCPQPMLENNSEIWWEFMEMVEAEYEFLTKYSDYQIQFESLNPELVDNNGRIIEQPAYTTSVSYKVTVTKGSEVQTMTFSTIVKGQYEN